MPWTDEDIEKAAKAFEDFDPESAVRTDISDLRDIAAAADAVSTAEARLTERVAIARAHGRSWTRIGLAIGVSRQAARQRFSGKVDVLQAGAGEVTEEVERISGGLHHA
jgi:hypothetical protein